MSLNAIIDKIEEMDNAHLNLLIQRMEQHKKDHPDEAHHADLCIGIAQKQPHYRKCDIKTA